MGQKIAVSDIVIGSVLVASAFVFPPLLGAAIIFFVGRAVWRALTKPKDSPRN
jgi:hypothetical protein